MTKLGVVAVLSLVSLGVAGTVPAAFGQNVISAKPGALNYVEGQAQLDDSALSSQAVGKTMLAAGQTIATKDGKAEVLLTPGVYVRLDSNSAVRMVSPTLLRTEVAVEHGRAEVEVDDLYKQNNLLVDVGHAQVRLQKRGLYELDADAGTVRVFDGKADAMLDGNERSVEVKSGHVLALNGDGTKPASFSEKHYEDELTDWSGLRSQYLGQSNERLATQYAGYGTGGGYAPGWAWDPAFSGYTWLPGYGLGWSPFGYGFYSGPYLYGGGYLFGGGLYNGGFYGGGYGGVLGNGYYNRHSALAAWGASHGGGVTGGDRHGAIGGFRGGAPAGGFRGGAGGGGFHGGSMGGGGFHGGGMGGGGFHGGGGGGHR